MEMTSMFGLGMPVLMDDTEEVVAAPVTADTDDALFDEMEKVKLSPPLEAPKVKLPSATVAELQQSLGIVDNSDQDK
jgi:hypothetical protein